MQQVNLSSFAALYRATGLPRHQIQRLRQGQVQTLPVASLVMLSQVLQMPLSQLIEQFTPSGEPLPVKLQRSERPDSHLDAKVLALQTEYQRLEVQLKEQHKALEQTFQEAVLQALESLLLQWPTAAYAAQQNPELPAVRILPLLRPLEQLLQSWGVEAIGSVGEDTTYDPQWHQPWEGTIAVQDRVRVRSVGYRRGEQLLYRAKVSPV